jgi:hypothetical protein
MSYVVTGMTDYVKAEGFNLIVKAVTEGRTASLVNVISGLKGTALVPFLTTAITLKAGGACGAFNGAGSTSTFSEVSIGVKPVLFEESVCVPALSAKELIYETSGSDALPYSQVFLNDKVKNISKGLDALVWLGDTGSSDAFSGFVVQGSALMTTITGFTGTTTVYDNIDLLIDTAVTADSTFESSDSVAVFLNYSKFRTLQKELVAKNYFHYNPAQIGDNMELLFPGTKIRVIATEGLAGHSFGYLADTAHLHVGTSLMSESEGILAYYDMPTNSILLRSQFFMGTGVSKAFYKRAI